MFYVRYSHRGVPGIALVSTLPLALSHAHELLEQGAEISHIEDAAGFQTMSGDEIGIHYTQRKAGGA